MIFNPIASIILNDWGSNVKSSALLSSGLGLEIKACILPKAVNLS
jgi:hypothetical protein